jgi:uncharacterized protein
MDRLELVRDEVDQLLRQQENWQTHRNGFIHLYGVSAVCVLLAVKRGLDPELCAIAGMLHDIRTYGTGDYREHGDHARLGAPEAERILNALGCFSVEEIETVRRAIARHSSKDEFDTEFDELLKDADVLQHYIYNPGIAAYLLGLGDDVPAEVAPFLGRWSSTLSELGMAPGVPGDG